jgi:hypothetical protein
MGTKITSRVIILVLAAATLAGGGIHTDPRTAPVVVGQGIRVFGADPEHERLVRWAFGRYKHAGIDAPAVDVHFHADTSGCYGHLGAELGGRVDVCVVIVSEIARDVLLHEMGHAWIDENVSAPVRERFLEMRGLRAWNDQSVIWDARGFEHGAEIIAWGVGTRYIAPSIPDRDPERLAAGWELLTSAALPHPTNV